MSVKFQDYYQTLGVNRDASAEDLQRAYRKLARQYHPDVNKDRSAEAKFKQINEAYEVLKDADKRKRYDQLGANWKAGQDFSPPPGWGEGYKVDFGGGRTKGSRGGRSRSRGEGFDFSDVGSGFSDFFEMFFGARGGGMGGMGGGSSPFDEAFGRTTTRAHHPEPQRTDLTISLEDAMRGATKRVTLRTTGRDARGHAAESTKTYDVKIPAGATDGTVIRLAGQGVTGDGAPAGDVHLRLKLAPHPEFRAEGHDLVATLALAPWEAALGAKVEAPTLDGSVTITVPPGAQTGQRLRLRGKGLPKRGGERGDLYFDLRIVVPAKLTDDERQLFERLAACSNFNARQPYDSRRDEPGA